MKIEAGRDERNFCCGNAKRIFSQLYLKHTRAERGSYPWSQREAGLSATDLF